MFIKLLLLVTGLLTIVFFAIGFNIFFRNKKFPKTSIGGNKEMRKLGLSCARHEEILCRRDVDGITDSSGCASCGH